MQKDKLLGFDQHYFTLLIVTYGEFRPRDVYKGELRPLYFIWAQLAFFDYI